MPPKGSSLTSLLGTLTNAAPVDFDPEALDADQPSSSTFANGNASDSGSGSEDDDKDDDEEEEEEGDEEYMNPRAHYADVGTSDMRKKAALSESEKINDPRYQGVKSSRAELYDDEEAEEEEEESDENEDLEDVTEEDEEEQDDDEEDISEDDEEEEDAPPEKTKQLRFAQDDDDDSEEEPSARASTSNSIAAQIAQSVSQAKALKARRVQDADKGRQVSKQIKTYERTLETRIKAQSVLRDVNRLPDPALYTQVISTSPTAMEPAITVLEQLLELSETLFSLRTRLNALSSATDADEGESRAVEAPATRKRKRDFDVTVPEDQEEASRTWTEIASHDQIQATVDDVVSFSRALEPQRRSVLDKWSLKVTSAAATAAAASNGNKFAQLRAVNQVPSAQIDSALAGDGLSRLISRTRVLRSADSSATSKLGSTATGDEEVQDDQVFDDTDFYSALLKELIERRSGAAGGGAAGGSVMLSTMLQAGGKKKKQNVDTRASKGRKLRYEVNDKLVNFMPPIRDRVKWGEDQIERLFRQLASSSMGVVAERDGADELEEEAEVEQEEAADLGGLRVFG